MTSLLRWVVTALLLALLASLVDLEELGRALAAADPLWFAAVVLVLIGDRLLMVAKWLPLLRIHVPDMPFWRALKAYLASNFAGFFLPASIGGDVLRTIGVGRDRKAVVEVGASVAVERILGLVASGVVALLALWLALRSSVDMAFLAPWALAAVGCGMAAAIVPFSTSVQRWLTAALGRFRGRRWSDLILRFSAACHAYRGHPGTLAAVAALSVLEQLVPVLAFLAAAQAMEAPVSAQALLVSVPLMTFAARLPISVSGIGVAEGGMVYLLGLFGVSPLVSLSLALVTRVAELLVFLPGAYWWRELLGNRSPP